MKRLWLLLMAIFFVGGLVGGRAFAQYSSSNYKVNELQFGAGGDLNSTSTSYQAQSNLGSLGVGNFSSAAYQSYLGFLTPNEPFLEFTLDTTSVDLGSLDTTTTKTGTATFHVKAYIDSGYTVQTVGSPPSYASGSGSHTLSGMGSQGGSVAGTEQFGINLKANNSPAVFGADPSPQPNSTFATGIAAPGYDAGNQFKYVAGDVIAQTPSGSSGWGQTNYTISYIANISAITPAGNYSMNHDLVVVATY